MNLPIKNSDENQEIFLALKDSIYPGAKHESVKMIYSYCKAKNLDPLLKVAHIVPMYVTDKNINHSYYRDVVMPGIALYRITAHRTGQYIGLTVPEFGPAITEVLDGIEVTYPEWCYLKAKKLVNGHIAEFEARELWKENYATANKDTLAPNKMWLKRPYGQLAKCTEAQVLRKAFPEELGGTVTYEEMEGKTEILDTDKVLELSSVNGVDKLKQALNISPTEPQEMIVEEAHEEIVDEGLPIMPIGKYKGKSMDEIPENYLQWLSANNQDYKSLADQELIRRQTN